MQAECARQSSAAADDPLIGTEEVCRMLGGCHQNTIYRYLTKKYRHRNFPRPARVVGQRLAWHRSQIETYIASRLDKAV